MDEPKRKIIMRSPKIKRMNEQNEFFIPFLDEEISEMWHLKEHSNSNDGSWHYRLGTLRWIVKHFLTKVKQRYEQRVEKENMLRIASLTLLVAEIQGCKDMDETGRILKSWINANDLEPEKVKTFNSVEEVLKYYEENNE